MIKIAADWTTTVFASIQCQFFFNGLHHTTILVVAHTIKLADSADMMAVNAISARLIMRRRRFIFTMVVLLYAYIVGSKKNYY